MNQEQYATLHRLREHLTDALHELDLLGKLPRVRQNIEFMVDSVDEYVNLQKDLDE